MIIDHREKIDNALSNIRDELANQGVSFHAWELILQLAET